MTEAFPTLSAALTDLDAKLQKQFPAEVRLQGFQAPHR